MVDKFATPKTKEEFLKQVEPVTPQGARAVLQGLNQKLDKVAGPIKSEIKFFEEALAYKVGGQLPERFEDG